jgi:integrase
MGVSMMTAPKSRPATAKVRIRLAKNQRFGVHNFRPSSATFLVYRVTDVKTIQGLLRHAKVTTMLDLYSQSIDASKLNPQKHMAMAITGTAVAAD